MGLIYRDNLVSIYHGDCRKILPSLSGISAVVTDPPYELGFMGKGWDSKGISFQSDTWRLIREACLPGAMLLSFGGTRTFHRIACAIEDAGWQIRDTIMWVYGSGFPKSLDISKAIDKKAKARREMIGLDKTKYRRDNKDNNTYAAHCGQTGIITQPATPESKLWEGYGTGLKPAYEPIIVAMNPLDGTFANNALKHKVAGLNIDECRIETREDLGRKNEVTGKHLTWGGTYGKGQSQQYGRPISKQSRFPANFIHDGSQEVMELFPDTGNNSRLRRGQYGGGSFGGGKSDNTEHNDSGSAARFFYTAKASRRERGEGNDHATVKPLSLMTYLCKLVKMPEYNLILDPFCGSGTTLLACKKLGIPCIGIDSNEEYCQIASKRCMNYRGPLPSQAP